MLPILLIALALTIAALIAPAFVPRHAPVHPRRHCRCGQPADIYEHERPWRSWCAGCHIKRLQKKGTIL